MKFKQSLRPSYGLGEICFVPFLDLVFLLFLFFIIGSGTLVPVTLRINLPKVITSERAEKKNISVLVTSENLIYFEGRLLTLKELRSELVNHYVKNSVVLIKADRRASLGQTIEIWNLCRELGIEEVDIASTP